jgi:sugar lactone lactonase YvrE
MRLLTPCFLILALCASARGQSYTIRTLAGSATQSPSGSVAVDSGGNTYFATDAGNAVFRVDATTGQATRFAGTGEAGYSGDNGPAVKAQLQLVMGLAADLAGNVYIAESGNRRIRKVSNGVITTVAGNGVDGYSGDGGPATSARLGALSGVAVDASGNLFIADNLNNVIRKVSNGVITTIAGNGKPIRGAVRVDHSDDDGPAIGAQLYVPEAVAVDAAGNVYIADSLSRRIRKVSDGRITTVAGFRTANSYWGDDGPATDAGLFCPVGMAVDPLGNVYVAEGTPFNAIRKVSEGVIGRIAGEVSKSGYSGDNGPATSARLNSPVGLAVDAAARVYIADVGNHVIRILVPGSLDERPLPGYLARP